MHVFHERAAYAWTEDSVRLVGTPSVLAKSSLLYIQEIGHFRTLAPYFTEREGLDSFLIVYTRSGTGRLTYRKGSYNLRPHQVFFIHCMEYQHYAITSDEPWEILWVHFNGHAARAYYEYVADSGDPVRGLPAESPFDRILEELIELHRFKSIRNELITSKLLLELVTELALTGPEIEPSGENTPAYLTNLLHFLDSHYHEKVTLEQLAKRAAVNKYHLAKQFKKHIGFPPGEYIIHLRITKAKELLQYSDLPVAEIAEQVGLDNVSHFIHLFKSRTELTPLAYRKSWRT
jgi:AraC-like DNA-binding protein